MPECRRRNTARARALRNDAPPAERALWRHLQDRKLGGYKFSRQVDIGGFHPDLVCRSHKLIVELDGDSLDYTSEEDAFRTRRLNQLGYRVIRFRNEDVFKHLEGVLTMIKAELNKIPSPPAGGRGTPRSGGGGTKVDGGAGGKSPPRR